MESEAPVTPARQVALIHERVADGRLSPQQGLAHLDTMLGDLERWQQQLDALGLLPGMGGPAQQLRARTEDSLRLYSLAVELLRRWLLSPGQVELGQEAVRTAREAEALTTRLRDETADAVEAELDDRTDG